MFWFIAEPDAEPKPSRMAGYFSKLPSNLDLLPDRYFNVPLYKDAMRGLEKTTVLRSRFWFSHDELNGIAAGNWVGKTRDESSSSGYVIATLEAALWCVHRTSSFEEAVILAVNLGHDSDTVTAVSGQLAGALYGRAGIPQRWLEKLVSRKQIEDRVAPLLRAGRQARKTEAQS